MSLAGARPDDSVSYVSESSHGDEFVTETMRSVFEMQRIRHGAGVSKVLRSERVTGGVHAVQEKRGGYSVSVPEDLPGGGGAESYAEFVADALPGDAAEGAARGYGFAGSGADGLLAPAGPGGLLPYRPPFGSLRSPSHRGAPVYGQRPFQRQSGHTQRHRALPVQNELRVRDPGAGGRPGGLRAVAGAPPSPMRHLAGGASGSVRRRDDMRPMLRGADHHPESGPLAEQAAAGLAVQPYSGPPSVKPVRCEYPDGGAGPAGPDNAHPPLGWSPFGPQKPILFFIGLPQLHPGGGGGAEGVQPVYGYTGTNIFLVGFYLLVPYLGGYRQAGGHHHPAAKCVSPAVPGAHERHQSPSVRGGRGGHLRARGKGVGRGGAHVRGVGLCRPQQDHRPHHIPQHSSFRGQPGVQQAPRKQRDVHQNQAYSRGDSTSAARWHGGRRPRGRGYSPAWTGGDVGDGYDFDDGQQQQQQQYSQSEE
ncbi:ORFL147C [Human betaherpesvirus 5]|nr:ORFL147C [Human betaherpesvirus 5]QHX40477.1 ORFL147C [Human betaherpesvirus 5]